MDINTIREFQQAYGYSQVQEWIDTGLAWKLEGSVGRGAMDALGTGACFLPDTPAMDYYGNRIPSRDELKDGSKGTLLNSQRFWSDSSNFID